MLHFTIAKAHSFEALERYRGKCEPTFLFYADIISRIWPKRKKVLEQDTE